MGTPAVHERPARSSSSGQAKQPSRLPGFPRWPPPCWPAPPLPTQHIMTQFWVGVPGSPGAISGPKELEDLFGRTPPPIHVQKAYFFRLCVAGARMRTRCVHVYLGDVPHPPWVRHGPGTREHPKGQTQIQRFPYLCILFRLLGWLPTRF